MKRKIWHYQWLVNILWILTLQVLNLSSLAVAFDQEIKIEFEKYHLENGLEVILHQDNRVPLVAVDVWYHVGSGDEVVTKSGFAHLFEHMLFQGSKNVGEDQHFNILKKVGVSDVNGSTNTDRTNYYQVLPSHHLETALWLESDRMGYLLPMLTKKSLDNQIEVVRNERRQRIDNVPYGPSRMKMNEMLYPIGHPYHFSIIGAHEDLEKASLEDVIGFYQKWYIPSNATLVLAGDFEKEKVKKLIEKWFGSFAKIAKQNHIKVSFPESKAQREIIEDKLAKLPQILYVWHTPPLLTEGDAEFDILSGILGDEGTGRLYKRLVLEEQLAVAVQVSQNSQQLSSYFSVIVQLKSDADQKKAEKILVEELQKVISEKVSPRELQRTVTQLEAAFVWRLESLLSKAELLQTYNHYKADPGYLTKDLARYRAVTPEGLLEMAQKYLAKEKRIELITLPLGKKGS